MKGLIFLGSIRDSSPPRPVRLGHRVALYLHSFFLTHWEEATLPIVDPLEIECSRVFKPHFSYSKGAAPKALQNLAAEIKEAQFFIMLSPEYNHSMSPALADLLNHFGSSLFAFKPSLIVTYSAGQWGGARAAVGMRSFLSELGCLPVSAMLHLPKAHEIFDVDGKIHADQDREAWEQYFARGLTQLRWWANAASKQFQEANPHYQSKAFLKDPSERNAP